MNNEKEIKRMCLTCKSLQIDARDIREIAETLINAGYGNVKQAVKEFGKRLKEGLWKIDGDWQGVDGEELCEQIDNLITKLYGGDNDE